MSPPSPFRGAAIAARERREERVPLPRATGRWTRALLAAAAATAIAALVVTLTTQVPVLVRTTGVVRQDSRPGIRLVAFGDVSQRERFAAGQDVAIILGSRRSGLRGRVEQVSKRVLSPDEARRRYRLGRLAGATFQPGVPIVVRFPAGQFRPDERRRFEGSVAIVAITVGHRALLTAGTRRDET